MNDRPYDAVSRLLATLFPPKAEDNAGTAAPGAQSRKDLITPDTPDAKTVTGKGVPASLGYHQHGDSPDLHTAEAGLAKARERFPTLASHGRAGPAVPEYNKFYDQLRTDDAYDKIITTTAHGTLVVPSTLQQTVTLDTPANLRTSQFPGAVLVHPVLMFFSFSQTVTTATGQYSFAWLLPGADFQYPLGEFNAGKADYQTYTRQILNVGVIDPGVLTLGSIVLTPTSVVGTPSINWRLGIGWAYDLPAPAYKGYIPLPAGIWQEAQQAGKQ